MADRLRVQPRLPRRGSEGGPGRTQESPGTSIAERLRRAVKKHQLNIYKYNKLAKDHLRLIGIFPRYVRDGEYKPDEIYVKLREVGFHELPSIHYEALSYHWGMGDAEKPIYARNEVNAGPGTPPSLHDFGHVRDVANLVMHKQFYVKPNLYRALYNLRKDKEPVTLWVDALCINQEDREEKEAQVTRMVEIYSKASAVLVWLGESDKRAERAMAFIYEVIELESLKNLVADGNRVDDWAALLYLMRSTWFSRRWVIQELALARHATVHCGASLVHWIDFRDAISLFVQNFDTIKAHFRRSQKYELDYYSIGGLDPLGAKVLVDSINNIFQIDSDGKAFEPFQGLEYLVSKLSTFEASDPRDTINALRNIARETSDHRLLRSSWKKQPPPQPNYEQNLLQVYTDFVQWVVETSGSIDIICRQWAIPEREKPVVNYPDLITLPSWIQQISESPFGRQNKASRGRIHGDSLVGLPGESSYDASHGMKARVAFGAGRIKPQASSNEGMVFAEAVQQATGAERDRKFAGFSVEFLEGLSTIEKGPSASDITYTNGRQSPPNGRVDASLPSNTAFETSDGAERRNNLEVNDVDTHEAYPSSSTNGQAPAIRPAVLGSALSVKLPELKRLAIVVEGETSPTSANVIQFKKGIDSSIEIHGIRIGTLNWITDPTTDGVIPYKALQMLRGNKKNDSKDEVTDKLWRTLVAERGPDGRNPPAWYFRACAYCLAHDSPNGHINTSDLLKKEQPDTIRRFLQRVLAVTWNRCFLEATTDDGDRLHGLAPPTAQPGDIVCILFGCSVPVVLRRYHDEGRESDYGIGEFYTFQGEAYVYGVMDGEAISSMSAQEIERKTTTFKLL